ncbi:DUF624 domain-containing protein [Sporosarcina psychrophila]|uniref:DUF624 domain-containing protein n=1 Tax=Sporosarcina psychrophila TaxID=1476 RepID=UPI003B9F2345
MNPTSGFTYNVFEWITRLAYIYLLWILFSLAGGMISGFFPATIAMFAISREWLKGISEIPIS